MQEIVGKSDEELWGKQANFLTGNDHVVLSSGKTIKVEEKLQASDGRWLDFTGVKMPLRDENNNIIGIIGNSLDITELKKAQAELKKSKAEAEALSRSKSEFIANMSHDVKTPLSGIIGLSEILSYSLTGKEADLVQNIFLAAQQLMNFFNNCLDIAKSENTDIVLFKERFNLKLLFNEIVDIFQPAAQSKNLDFYFYYDEKIPDSLIGSRAGIYRIFLNLVGNAIKFTSRGKVSLYVRLSKKSTERNPVVHITIEDTGIGIPKDKQKIIFEKFTRLTPSYQGIYEGSGIGLYIVSQFIQSMQGEIYVNSEEEKGSRFVVLLPLEKSLLNEEEYNDEIMNDFSHKPILDNQQTQTAITNLNNHYDEKLPDINSKNLHRVLLVEDSLIAQQVAKLILVNFANEIDMADTGNKAIELFKAGKYDLVLMDIGLPDMQGFEVTKILRNMEKETAYHVPIVALTAHASDAVKKECLNSGMEEVFNKPLSTEQMKNIIEKYIFADKPQTILEPSCDDIPVISENFSKEILGLFVQTLPEFCADMEKAYHRNDIDNLISIVHKFHGSVCYTETPQLLDAAKRMETALKNSELKKLDSAYQNLKNAIRNFEIRYKLL